MDVLPLARADTDAVFAYRTARDKLANSPELAIFSTFLPRTPQELADWLDKLPRSDAAPSAADSGKPPVMLIEVALGLRPRPRHFSCVRT